MATNWLPEQIIQRYLIKPFESENINIAEVFSTPENAFVEIDIGSGNGHFLVDMAQDNPENNFIGIEIKFDRVCKTISKLSKRGIDNVKLYHGNAYVFLSEHLVNNSVNKIYYNFPDPWPKRRHHKKRLFNNEFLNILSKVMTKDGVFTCATDHAGYLNWMLDFIESYEGFEHVFVDKIVNEIPGYHGTLFEEMWRKMGKEIFYYRIHKKK